MFFLQIFDEGYITCWTTTGTAGEST